MSYFIQDIKHIAEGAIPNGSAPVGVVDIGSNSIRLVIYEGLTRTPNILFNEKIQAGLGASVASTGKLSDLALEQAFRALNRFRFLAKQAGAKSLNVLATAAVREAENGPYFIDNAQRILNADIHLLTGEQEADYAALGVTSSFDAPIGVVGDMGGGSLELLHLDGSGFNHGITLPLGGLRLFHDSGADPRRARQIAESFLQNTKVLSHGKGQDFFAVGGTWRNIAKLYMAETDYTLRVIHDFQMSQAELQAFCDVLQTKDIKDLRSVNQVSPARRELLSFGAAVLSEIMRIMDAPRVRFSAFGVREGFLTSFMDKETIKRDPLITAAYHFAVLRSRSAQHALELCEWTDRAFKCFGIKEEKEEIRLRWASCLLADIAWRAHPDYRGQQSVNIISHGDFVALDHSGRAYMALVSYYRNEGVHEAQISRQLLTLVSDDRAERARLLGCLLRLGYLFTASMPDVLKKLKFKAQSDGSFVVVLPSELSALDGDRPQRRAKQVGQLLNSDFTIMVE